jgi:glycosyltransferase involved in cell wall biosynthesis
MIKVSICIPTYSRLNYLKELINSCLIQKYKNFEICISQDVTPDGLITEIQVYCEELVKNHPKIIRYKAQTENLGLAGNWNALVEMATSEYVFIPGDDDLITSDFLEKLVAHETQNADVIFCNQLFINEKSEVLYDLTKKLNNKYGRDNLNNGWLSEPIRNVLQHTIPMSASLIKRKWLTKISFDTRINSPELEVFLKIAINNGRFYYMNKQLASYRVHESSATSTGLTIGQYLSNIIDIEVAEEYKTDKAKLISNSIIQGINNALKSNNVSLAKKLIRSEFYPINVKLKKTIQIILIYFPNYLTKIILLKLR